MPPAKASAAASALEKFRKGFEKSFGEGQLVTYAPDFRYDVIPTGSIALDYALGVGGMVKGRITELWGPEQLGKSTQCILTMAEAQRAEPEKMQGWIDVEKTWDPHWAEAHGVDLDRVLIVQPGDAEEVADMAKEMVASGLINMLTLDSVGAMIGRTEKEKDAEEATVAIVAKIVTRMTKLMAAEAPRRGVAIAVINQARANIGANGPRAATITRTGGFALSHVTTHRLKFAKGRESYMVGTKTDNNDARVQVGQQVAITIEKNKVAPPKRTALLTYFNQPTEQYGPVGIDRAFDAFSMGNQLDVFGRRGSWYDLPDGTEHNGAQAVLGYLRGHREAIDAIRTKVMAKISGDVVQEELQEG